MNLNDIKKSFPLFTNQPDLVYLDSAATALKPDSVITAETKYYKEYSSNIARGSYPLAEQATEAFEKTRAKVAIFIGAKPEEIIFTSGTTTSINLAADLLASQITEGDNIIITAAEHHSNFLPWKELCQKKKAELRIAPITKEGFFDLAAFQELVDAHTKVVAFGAVSNVLGLINPVEEIVHLVKNINSEALVIIDAAQAVGHIPVDVTEWNADFVAFSGHKMFGPTGIGILYGKHALLKTLSPVSFGGGMVLDACAPETLYKEVPTRFEAGTPNIAGVIGLGKAIEFIEAVGTDTIHTHENALALSACQKLKEAFGQDVEIIGTTTPEARSGIVSFTLSGIHPHDVAHLLGERGICVRAGLHCAAPLHKTLDLSATTRLSFSIYNTEHDIEKLILALKEIREIL